MTLALRTYRNDFGDSILRNFFQETNEQVGTLKTNVKETQDSLIFHLEVPGVTEKDLKVQFDKEILTVSGLRQSAETLEGEKEHLCELSSGKFTRSFKIHTPVDADHLKATLKHGILTVLLPKSQESRVREIPVLVD